MTKATSPYRLGESSKGINVFYFTLIMMMTVMMMVMRKGRVSPSLILAAVRVKKER